MSKAVDDLVTSAKALDDDVDAALAAFGSGNPSPADIQKLADVKAALDGHKAAIDAALGTTPPATPPTA